MGRCFAQYRLPLLVPAVLILLLPWCPQPSLSADIGGEKKMDMRGACFDIDGTLTTHLMGYHPVGYFEFILAGMLCVKGVLPFDALEKVCAMETMVPDADPLLAAERLGIDCAAYREELMRYQKKFLHRHNDALALLGHLCDAGVPVYITTNNTRTRAEMVLDSLGIRGKIRKIYTPQLTGARKKSPDFWRFVITDTGIPGSALLVVGDEEVSDSIVPLQAGFGSSCLLPPEAARNKLPMDWMIKKIMNHKLEKGEKR